MSTIPLNDTTPRVQYTASAGQTVFVYTFWVTEADDLSVYVDGTLLDPATDFTITGALNPTGGDVVLATPATEGQVITVERNIPFERVSEFQEAGTFKASVLNLEFSKQLAMMQQLKRDIARKIGLSPTSSVGAPNLVLPDPVDGKALVFDGVDGTLRTSTVDIDSLDSAISTVTTASSNASASASTASTAATTASAAQAAAEAARDEALANAGSAKVTATDTTPAPLNSKIAAGQLMFKSVSNPGGDEVLAMGVAIADQATAESGVSDTVAMTPLKTKQAIDENAHLELLAYGTATNSAGVFFSLPAGYKHFKLVVANGTVAAANTNIVVELQRSSVPQVIDSVGHTVTPATTSGLFANSGTTGLLHRTSDLDNDPADQFAAIVEIAEPRNAGISTFYSCRSMTIVGAASPTSTYINDVVGMVGAGANAGDDDTLVLKGDTANFSGTYTLYGVK